MAYNTWEIHQQEEAIHRMRMAMQNAHTVGLPFYYPSSVANNTTNKKNKNNTDNELLLLL